MISVVLTVLLAAYAVAGTHDAFGLYRAKAAAVAEVRASGVPPTAINGGFEHNGMTQIEQFGYMNNPLIRVPAPVFVAHHEPFPADCEPYLEMYTPAIVPGYSLSFDPHACGGSTRFAPVAYYNWLGFRSQNLYIVNTVKSVPSPR